MADGFETPVHWNAETGENILWSTPIPGLGHSSPIVWGDVVCVTTADSGEADELKIGLYGDIESVTNDRPQRWEVRCLDKATGDELWRMAGGGDIPTPTPVVSDGLIFITNAHGDEAPILAINEGASGDITPAPGTLSNDHLVWSHRRDGAYMQTPIVYRGLLYNCRDNGVLSVYEPRTGRRLYQARIAGGGSGFTASPVAADGKVYFSSEDGSVYVLKAGPEPKVLSENPMGETLMATPALSAGVLYFRTRGHLVAVGPA